MLSRLTQIYNVALAAGALSALLFSPAALAAGTAKPAANADAQAQYQKDVARCKSGDTNQDRATCMREAGAALNEARHNRLVEPGAAYAPDATKRCKALPAAQQQDCLTQMSGQNTTTQGSVGSGGILRETVIPVVPAPTSPLTPVPTPTPAPTR